MANVSTLMREPSHASSAPEETKGKRGLSRITQQRKGREEVVAIDFTTRVTRAIYLRGRGESFAVVREAQLEAPRPDTEWAPKLLEDHLKAIRKQLGAKTRDAVLIIGMEDSCLRNVEAPYVESAELRRMLRLNTKYFFHQDEPGSVFDVYSPPRRTISGPSAKEEKQHHFLVASAKQTFIQELREAAKSAGFNPIQVIPSQAALACLAWQAEKKAPAHESVLLLHTGTRRSTVSFVMDGDLRFNRSIGIGTQELASRLAEAHKVPSSMPEELKFSVIQSNIQGVLATLAREIRAAIDYFEDVHGRRVAHGFISGDLAKSDLVLDSFLLLEIPCQRLNWKSFVDYKVREDTESKDWGALDLAVGGGLDCLGQRSVGLNLLRDDLEEAALRRRDPVRWAIGGGALASALLLSWAGYLKVESSGIGREISQAQAQLAALEKPAAESIGNARLLTQKQWQTAALDSHVSNRFLWALPLDALQRATVEEVQVVNVKIEQTLQQMEGVKGTNGSPSKPSQTKEAILLVITAKNYGDLPAEEQFIERISTVPYFQKHLRTNEPVLLKNRTARQVDPLDTSKSFTLFTLECFYPERIIGHE